MKQCSEPMIGPKRDGFSCYTGLAFAVSKFGIVPHM